ncbi:uncharacterized protein LOC18053553 isoform X2 [Citrus clementina]|uniref:uncharacterized protein LOC18053553 isoform X2 n=1 Tax=Citrus clementina TaxID=85681 RepID=UPI000CECF874|nr:uncharacterized protein LOC18053553 isoform X2 [Citrus x clementina]
MEAESERKVQPSYYSVLGVSVHSSVEEIRRAYRKLAMQWHPDRWTKTPSLLGKAKVKFQEIQEAYSVLSDERKRTLYDAGLYDPEEEEEEGFSDFVQEMLSLMAEARKELKKATAWRSCKQCSWKWHKNLSSPRGSADTQLLMIPAPWRVHSGIRI